MTPYEIIAGPLTLYYAEIGTAFPDINEAPDDGDWTLVGTNGDRNYSEDGVKVSHAQSLNYARPAGATGPVKAFLDTEDLKFTVTLWDMTLEQYALALNGNAVGTTAAGVGTAGFKKLGLSRSPLIKEYALLARGTSAYDEDFAAQYEVPRCVHSGSPEPVFRKGVPAGIMAEYTALEDLEASSDEERFGRLIMQHQAPTA